MRIVLQEFFVVIGFDHERLRLAQAFDDHLRRVAKIGDETQHTRAGVKCQPKRIDGVVRYGKCLHRDVADRELGTGRKNSPISVPI